jgi:hypothetical protein
MGNVAKLGSVKTDKNDKPMAVGGDIKILSCDVDDHGIRWY